MRVVTFQNTAVTVNFFVGKCYLKNKYLADFIFATIKSRDKMNKHHPSLGSYKTLNYPIFEVEFSKMLTLGDVAVQKCEYGSLLVYY